MILPASDPSTPRTPTIKAVGTEEMKRTPGGMALDIVLTPALRPPPPGSAPNSGKKSPRSSAEIAEKLASAESRREELLLLKKENIDEKLALVQGKKVEIINEKAMKTKEELESRFKSNEANKNLIMKKSKDDVKAHLAKVEQKIKDLEVSTEAEKVAKKFAIDADIMKAEEKRSDLLEKKLKGIQEHVDYVKIVSDTQERKKQAYLASLEQSLAEASQRKEEVVAKIIESAKEEGVKIEEAKMRREEVEKKLQEKTKAVLNEKISRVEENQANKEDQFKSKVDERNRKAELVRQNKLKVEESGDLVPESA